MSNTLDQVLEDNLIQIWSERDEVRRLKAIKNIYAADFTVFEIGEKITGYDSLNKKVSETLGAMPEGFAFTKIKPIIVNNNVGRMVWGLGPKGKPSVATGMDIVFFENNKIKSTYVFLDSKE